MIRNNTSTSAFHSETYEVRNEIVFIYPNFYLDIYDSSHSFNKIIKYLIYHQVLIASWSFEFLDKQGCAESKALEWQSLQKIPVTSPISVMLNYFPFCLKLELVSILSEIGTCFHSTWSRNSFPFCLKSELVSILFELKDQFGDWNSCLFRSNSEINMEIRT